MKNISIEPFYLDAGDLFEQKPGLCGSLHEIARAAGFRRPESILKRVPAGKKLVPIMALVNTKNKGE